MDKTQLLPATLLMLAPFAFGQHTGLSSSKPVVKHQIDNSPVTCTEARKTLVALESAFESVLGVGHIDKIKLRPGSEAVKRSQILEELDRIQRSFQPYYTLKARTQYCNPAAVRFPGADRPKAIRLIKLGFVEPVSKFVAGPGDTLKLGELVEALGFFAERWCDDTHLPSIKWSPELMPSPTFPRPRAGSPAPAPVGASRPRASS